MRTKLSTRQKVDQQLVVLLPADLKRALFEAAAERGVPAAHLTRLGIAAILRAA